MKSIPLSPIRSLAAMLAIIGLGSVTTAFAQNTAFWQGVSGTSVTTNWSDNANWLNSAGGNPGYTNNNVVFGNTGVAAAAGTVNSVANTSGESLSLTFTNQSNVGNFHTVLIPAGVTLSNANTLRVGVNNTNNGYATTVHFTGGGTLYQRGAAMTIKNHEATSQAGVALLNLSGLSNFVYAAPAGTLNVSGASAGSEARASGILWLAAHTNHITVGTIALALGTGNGPANNIENAIVLGPGTNVINVGTVNIAGGKINIGKINFETETGGLRLRGVNGGENDRANFTLGNRGNTGTGTIRGSLLFNGHPVDIKAGTMTLGQSTPNQGGQNTTGVLEFDMGVVDATTINLAVCSGNATAIANGIVTVGSSGTLLVGNMSLANQTLGVSTGNLNISNGTVVVSGSLTKSTAAGTGNVNMDGGSLTVQNQFGTAANPISALNITNATLTVSVGTPVRVNVSALNVSGGGVINVSSIPAPASYPAQLPLIQYASVSGDPSAITLGSLPGIYQGYLVHNVGGQSIDLVVTNGPVFLGNLTWTGIVNGNWDSVTTNWSLAGDPSVYFDGNPVLFNDTASATAVNLTTALAPQSIEMANSTKTYTFSGPGSLQGTASFVKDGSGTLILDHDGVSTFNGGFFISNGLVRVGQGTGGGSLGTGAVHNDGILVVNKTNNLTIAGHLSGTGSLTNNGTGTTILSVSNSFSGGLAVNSGAVRLNVTGAGGQVPEIRVSSGATLAAGGTHNNSVRLTNSTLTTINAELILTNGTLTIPAGTVNTFITGDHQTPTTSRNIQVDGTLNGSGTILVKGADNIVNPDGNQGVRFRSTSAGDFSGLIIYTNNTKGEIRVNGSGPYTPVNTGKFRLHAGAYNGDNTMNAPATGGYMIFNINNLGGSTDIPSDFEVVGTGAVIFNGLGTVNGSLTTLGNLRIGGGQELIGYRGANANTNTVAFSSVTLTGGTVTVSPKSPVVGIATQAGTHIGFNNVSQLAASSIVMNGLNTFTLGGTINYSGSTTVSNGTLAVTGSKSGGSGIAVHPAGALAGTGTIAETVTVSGTLRPGNASSLPSSLVINGNLTLDNNTNVFVLGASAEQNTRVTGVSTLSVVGSPVIRVSIADSALLSEGSTYTLFTFVGTLPATTTNQFQIEQLPGYQFALVNPATTPNQLKLQVVKAAKNLRWLGCVNANWNFVTANWNNGGGMTCNALFSDLDAVTLTSESRTNIILVGELQPGSITITNDHAPFTIEGSGFLSGSTGLRMDGFEPVFIRNTGTNTFTGTVNFNSGVLHLISGGLGTGPMTISNTTAFPFPELVLEPSGTLVLPNTISGGAGTIRHEGPGTAVLSGANNTFGAPVTVNAGILMAGADSALGSTNGTTTVMPGATLDVGGRNLASERVIVGGHGIGSAGAIVNNGTNAATQALRYVTLTEDVTFGGSMRWDIRGTVAALEATSPANITKKGTNQVSLVGLTNLNAGTLIGDIDIQEGVFAIQTTTGQVGDPAGTVTVHTNAILNFFNLNVAPFNKNIVVNNGGTIWNESGTTFIVGPITMNNNMHFNAGGTVLVLSNNAVTGSLNRFTKSGTGSLKFVGNALPSALTYEVLGGTLDLQEATVTSLSLGSGRLLRGHGTILGDVTSGSGAVITPGPNGTNAIGTLTVSNTVALQAGSQTIMELNAATTTSDRIVTTNITYGGTLVVTNIDGTLAGGQSFQLFAAGSYGGGFTSVQLPPLTGTLEWTNTLSTDGRITVIGDTPAVILTPRIVSAVRSGSNLIMSGTNGTTNGTFFVITSTNIATPLTNWTKVSTNTFGADGTFNVTNAINPALPRQFFDLLQQVP